MRFPLWAGAAALLIGIVLGLWSDRAPSRASKDFDLARAEAIVAEVAQRPHVSGSPDHARVRDWIAAEFAAMGYRVETQNVSGVRQSKRGDKSVSASPVINIIAVRSGRDANAPAVALMAHYDSVSHAPGAGDDAAGVAAVLESARVLAAGPVPERDVVFLITDAEELGLIGAEMFYKHHPLAASIGAVVNVEARGSSGRAIMFQTSEGNDALISLWAKHAIAPAGNSLADSIYKRLPNDTDLTIALDADKIGINASFIDGYADYHMPTDSAQSLDRNSLSHLGSFALTTTRALAMAKSLPAPGGDRVYFDVFGLTVVHYPAALGWFLCAFAAVLFFETLRRETNRWRVLNGLGSVLAAIAFAGVASHVIANTLYGAGTLAFRERLTEAPLAFWIWLALSFGALLLLKPNRYTWLGAAALLLLLAIVTQIFLPGGNWLFVWPLIIALLIDLAAKRFGTTAALIGAVIATLTFAFVFQTVHVFYVSVGTMSAGVVALVIPFTLVLLGPMFDSAGTASLARRSGAALIAASAVGLAALAFTSGFSARHPKPGDLFHLTDHGKSFWATSSKARDLPPGPAEYAPLKVFRTTKLWRTPAPAASAPSPNIALTQNGPRVTLRMTSDSVPQLFVASLEPEGAVTDVRVNGELVTLNEGKPTRIMYRAAAPLDLTVTFSAESAGKMKLITLLAEEGLPEGAPDPGGPPVNWTWLSHSRANVESKTLVWK